MLPIVGAVLVAAPAFGPIPTVSPQRAGRPAAGGAIAVVLYRVLFVLTSVGSSTSPLGTLGVAAGVIAAWIAPSRGRRCPSRPLAGRVVRQLQIAAR